jgi:hypothetical protein
MAITVTDKVSVEVENYNGTYSIKEGWINREGKFNPNWCVKEFGKEKTKKNVPVSVRLGDRDTALAVLGELYREISGGEEIPF